MKLLIITQKVDERDEVLGFMHRWIEEFARQCETVVVICLEQGVHHLPGNVKVLSLGKEHRKSRFRYALRFWYFIWRERHEYDAVFVHMNQVYVLLGWLLWRFGRKKIALWYAHGAVSPSLRIAEKMAEIVFTSTASGFRIPSAKTRIVGQGIDTDHFTPLMRPENPVPKIIMVGRLSPSKDQDTLIKALGILREAGEKFQAEIIGSPGRDGQESYAESLHRAVQERSLTSLVTFTGGVPHKDILSHLQHADIFVNTGLTGSLDKAGLEAMATGLPVLTCNEAYEEVLKDHQGLLMFEKKDSRELADKLSTLLRMDPASRQKLREDMREIIITRHRVEGLVIKITKVIESL